MKRFPPSEYYVGIEMENEKKAHWRFDVRQQLEDTCFMDSNMTWNVSPITL